MKRQKVEGVKGYLEILNDGVVLSRKDDLLDCEISSGLTYIGYDQIFKVDFETAGKFTNGFLHFILKDQLGQNVFDDSIKKGHIFLFDFLQNDLLLEIKDAIVKKIEDSLPLDHENTMKKLIESLSELKELHLKGILTKKQFDDKKKNLLKKM